jgi:hypothetical protein
MAHVQYICGALQEFFQEGLISVLIPVAARSKAWIYGRSLTGIVGSNPA